MFHTRTDALKTYISHAYSLVCTQRRVSKYTIIYIYTRAYTCAYTITIIYNQMQSYSITIIYNYIQSYTHTYAYTFTYTHNICICDMIRIFLNIIGDINVYIYICVYAHICILPSQLISRWIIHKLFATTKSTINPSSDYSEYDPINMYCSWYYDELWAPLTNYPFQSSKSPPLRLQLILF